MATYDRHHSGYRVFVGGVNPRVGKYDLEQEFDRYGQIVDVWVARNPPGFAFLVYKHSEDADKAVRQMDGRRAFGSRLRVEHANMPSSPGRRGRGGGRGGGLGRRRMEKNGVLEKRSRSLSRSRSRSRDRRRRRSPSRSGSRSPIRRRSHSRSPKRRSPSRSRSPVQNSRSHSRSRSHSQPRYRNGSADRNSADREEYRKNGSDND